MPFLLGAIFKWIGLPSKKGKIHHKTPEIQGEKLKAQVVRRSKFNANTIYFTVIIHIFDRQSSLKISFDRIREIVHEVLDEEGEKCEEVNIYLVDTLEISQLHEQFFQDSSPTDCISFPIDEDENENDPFSYRILGEVFVCPDTAINYAKKHLGNPYEETILYIVHGLLHLMGYDDLEEKDRLLMRQAETRHMKNLKERGLIQI